MAYTVLPNTGISSRTANLTIAGQTLTVTQAAVQTYVLTITKSGAGSGMVANSPSGTAFSMGTTVTLTATPSSTSTFAGWSGACSGSASTCHVTMNSNVTVGAAFAFRTGTFVISASAGPGGSISPSGPVSVGQGSNRSFTIEPNSGYRLSYLLIDGKIIRGSTTAYTFSNVVANHAIAAYFRKR